jgi:hypothetical protein
MRYFKERREIILDKELNNLDKFVIDFTKLLPNYVLVSGYVSILTGRSRATEDVDLLIPKMSFSEFENLWVIFLENGFECINTPKAKDAFEMLREHAIRFARKGRAIPNMEFKFMSNDLHDYSFEKKIKVLLGDFFLFISPLEMQIAYKLFLGSNKDFEDAKHLYELFKEDLDFEELKLLLIQLNVKERLELII